MSSKTHARAKRLADMRRFIECSTYARVALNDALFTSIPERLRATSDRTDADNDFILRVIEFFIIMESSLLDNSGMEIFLNNRNRTIRDEN